jgi:hypothetical protein
MMGIDLRGNYYFGQKKKWVQHMVQSHVRKKEAFFIRLYDKLLFFKWP